MLARLRVPRRWSPTAMRVQCLYGLLSVECGWLRHASWEPGSTGGVADAGGREQAEAVSILSLLSKESETPRSRSARPPQCDQAKPDRFELSFRTCRFVGMIG